MSAPAFAAVFLDRDGTLVRDPGYLHQVRHIELLPGVGPALGELTRRGWRLIVVSNQSGIARGMYDAHAFHQTMNRLHELVSRHGARLLAAYYCPHHPDVTGPCACRKPGPRLYERAHQDYRIDLGASWYVGNRYSDAEPAIRFGGRGILLTDDAAGDDACRARSTGVAMARDFPAILRIIGTPGG